MALSEIVVHSHFSSLCRYRGNLLYTTSSQRHNLKANVNDVVVLSRASSASASSSHPCLIRAIEEIESIGVEPCSEDVCIGSDGLLECIGESEPFRCKVIEVYPNESIPVADLVEIVVAPGADGELNVWRNDTLRQSLSVFLADCVVYPGAVIELYGEILRVILWEHGGIRQSSGLSRVNPSTIFRLASVADEADTGRPVQMAEGDFGEWEQNIVNDLGGPKYLIKEIISFMRCAFFPLASESTPSSKCALLYGITGVGKTKLMKSVLEHLPHFLKQKTRWVNCALLFAKYEGDTELQLEKLLIDCFGEGGLLVLDNVELLLPAPVRGRESSSTSASVKSMVKFYLDNCASKTCALVGITSSLGAVDSQFVKPGRFASLFALKSPLPEERKDMFRKFVRNSKCFASLCENEAFLSQVACRTHGFLAADFERICKEAELIFIKHKLYSSLKDVSMSGIFFKVLDSVRPASLSEFSLRLPSATFNESSLAGIDDIREILYRSVIGPFRRTLKASVAGRTSTGPNPMCGVLLYGPPGTGKSAIASCLAVESQLNVISIHASELRSKVVGESEQKIKSLFSVARASGPLMILIDNIDVLTYQKRDGSDQVGDRLLTCLLTEMDGVLTKNELGNGFSSDMVVVVGTTNLPHIIDPAILRPGRLELHIHVPAPNRGCRRDILASYLSRMPCEEDLKSQDVLESLSERTECFSGADLENMCREGALYALREDHNSSRLLKRHILEAMADAKPSLRGWSPLHPVTVPYDSLNRAHSET